MRTMSLQDGHGKAISFANTLAHIIELTSEAFPTPGHVYATGQECSKVFECVSTKRATQSITLSSDSGDDRHQTQA